MPGTIIPHEVRDSCHRFCFASTAHTEMVIRTEKWPRGAACCSVVLLCDTLCPVLEWAIYLRSRWMRVWKQDGDQDWAQKYFSLRSNWHLGACHHLLCQGSKLASAACRWTDIFKFLKSWGEFQYFSVVAMKIVPILYQKTAEVYSSEALRFFH